MNKETKTQKYPYFATNGSELLLFVENCEAIVFTSEDTNKKFFDVIEACERLYKPVAVAMTLGYNQPACPIYQIQEVRSNTNPPADMDALDLHILSTLFAAFGRDKCIVAHKHIGNTVPKTVEHTLLIADGEASIVEPVKER